MFKFIVTIFSAFLFITGCHNQNNNFDKVSVSGRQILVNNEAYLIKGICYHPVPKGSEARSFETIDEDIELMLEAGINTIRVYVPIEEQSVLDKIDAAGLKVIIGFGYNQNGHYDILSGSFLNYVEKYKTHNAILLWELGNEYNYHPEWFGGDLKNWYMAMNNAAKSIKQADPYHLVTTAHGELPDSLALAMSPNIDVWGMNVYRSDNPAAVFKQWEAISTKPMYLSEAGTDSYMTIANAGYEQGVNEKAQADAVKKILDHVFHNTEVCSGLTLFAFVDELWKAGDVHTQDVGGWAPNSFGLPYDGAPNEEFWGILTVDREKKQAFYVVKEKYKRVKQFSGEIQ